MMRLKHLFAIFLFFISSSPICASIDQSDNIEVKNAIEFIDLYFHNPLCGDKPLALFFQTCFCGNVSLSGYHDLRDGDHYCCVPPSASGQRQCDPVIGGIRCENGEVKEKTQSCHKQCWNPYRSSNRLAKTASLYCQEEDYCLSLKQMCSGVCKEESDLCKLDGLRCIGDGYDVDAGYNFADDFKVKFLDTKLGKDHSYCLQINNDAVYDSISRQDEEKVYGTNQQTVDYDGLVKCEDSLGHDGIQCSEGCKLVFSWCTGKGNVCKTEDGTIVSMDNPELCRNSTFWRKNNFSCDSYAYSYIGVKALVLISEGKKCSSDYQQCIQPWYADRVGNTNNADLVGSANKPTCIDHSDQVFPINTSCQDFNFKFLDTYWTNWCTDERNRGIYCNNLHIWWFSLSVQNTDLIRDPHGCEKSCRTTTTAGSECLACEHPDYFDCNSTGHCIHKSNVCDGHPHPRCGGDDEGIVNCLDIYFKRRIVKNYATFICPSKMYPEMETLAVVCDDNIECHEDRDERLCATGADKYNPLVYAMTVGTCMIYVGLKIVWFFHQRHLPLGDEGEDDMNDIKEDKNEGCNI